MDPLNELAGRCKAGVIVTINEHRAYYQNVVDYLKEEGQAGEDVPKEVINKMMETNTLISIQFYPDTPIGFYIVYHYNLDNAIGLALAVLNNRNN